jgi:hypothetical protein
MTSFLRHRGPSSWTRLHELAQRIHRGLGLTGLFAVVACGGNSPAPAPIVLHDTTGAEYQYVCDQQPCSIVPTAKSPAFTCTGKSTGWSYSWDRFFTIVVFGAASLERPVACTTSTNCPTAPDGTVYACIDRLCQKPGSTGNVVKAIDAVNLCQASDPWPSDCGTAFLDDPAYGVAANKVLAVCPSAQVFFSPSDAGSPDAMCSVPPSCLQP